MLRMAGPLSSFRGFQENDIFGQRTTWAIEAGNLTEAGATGQANGPLVPGSDRRAESRTGVMLGQVRKHAFEIETSLARAGQVRPEAHAEIERRLVVAPAGNACVLTETEEANHRAVAQDGTVTILRA